MHSQNSTNRNQHRSRTQLTTYQPPVVVHRASETFDSSFDSSLDSVRPRILAERLQPMTQLERDSYSLLVTGYRRQSPRTILINKNIAPLCAFPPPLSFSPAERFASRVRTTLANHSPCPDAQYPLFINSRVSHKEEKQGPRFARGRNAPPG